MFKVYSVNNISGDAFTSYPPRAFTHDLQSYFLDNGHVRENPGDPGPYHARNVPTEVIIGGKFGELMSLSTWIMADIYVARRRTIKLSEWAEEDWMKTVNKAVT